MDLSRKILSDIIVFMKYARFVPNEKRREVWDETVARNMLMHMEKYPNLLDEISKAYQLVYNKKVLPSMRSLQFGGRAIEVNPCRMFNCSYVPIDDYLAFPEIMFLLLCGCGVGFSVQQHHVKKLPNIKKPIERKRRHLIQDTIEGWADAVKVLFKSYFFNLSDPVFDFSLIREKGSLLHTSGGKAPGPQPLKDCLHSIKSILDSKSIGSKLSPLECHDLICHISDAVLSGGIRRSSALSLFSLDDQEMLHCKYGNWQEDNPQRAMANNSAVLLRHRIKRKDFDELWQKIRNGGSGEPGFIFSNNMEIGFNPCAEVSLREKQFCNLAEVNVSYLESEKDFHKRVKAAAFIATLQAGYTDFHYLREEWREQTEKDCLIGVSLTGIASGEILQYDLTKAAEIVREENERVAKLIGINIASRTTCIKPSGTASLVLGCSSGIHNWHSPYYLRRVRVMKNEEIYVYLSKHLPDLVEDDYFNPINQAVITFPIAAPKNSFYRDESVITFLERIKKFYNEWVVAGHRNGDNTNNISATISIKDMCWDSVRDWMFKNRNNYNGLSVLPYDGGSYIQSPFEECTKYMYDKYMSFVKDIDLTQVTEEEDKTNLKENYACSGINGCEIV